MTEGYVRVPADSTGKKLRTVYSTIGTDEVHNEGVIIVDPTTPTQVLAVDSNGKIGVSSMPTITETNSAAIKTAVELIDNAISGSEMQVDVVAALPAGTNLIGNVKVSDGTETANVTASNELNVLETNSGAIKTAVETIDNAISGNEMQVDVVAPLPAGTNEIGNVKISDGTEQVNVNASNQLEVSVENTPTVNTQQTVTYDHASFDSSSSGNLVAAVASKVTKVHGLTIQAQGTVVVNITDGDGGSSLAEWSFQAREGAVYSFAPYPAHWMQTSVNTALYVQLSASQTVTMNCVYSDEDGS